MKQNEIRKYKERELQLRIIAIILLITCVASIWIGVNKEESFEEKLIMCNSSITTTENRALIQGEQNAYYTVINTVLYDGYVTLTMPNNKSLTLIPYVGGNQNE